MRESGEWCVAGGRCVGGRRRGLGRIGGRVGSSLDDDDEDDGLGNLEI